MRKSYKILMEILTSMVDNPDQVKIEESTDDLGVLYTIHLAQEDVGRVIGKGGDTIKCIRSITRLVGYTEEIRASIKIFENDR